MKRKSLLIELAAVIDGGKAFVQVTYKLESDVPLIFTAYPMLQDLATAASQRHYPNLRAQAEKLGKIPAEMAALEKYGKDQIQMGITLSSCKSSMFSLTMLSVLSRLQYWLVQMLSKI